MFRIGDTLFNEKLGSSSNLKMKNSINSQVILSNYATKITYIHRGGGGGGAVCKLKHLLVNYFDLLNSLGFSLLVFSP
jgi:hypothetical protein